MQRALIKLLTPFTNENLVEIGDILEDLLVDPVQLVSFFWNDLLE